MLQIEIPDLYATPYVSQDVILEDRVYSFEYRWNFRAETALLDIYVKDGEDKVALILGIGLVVNSDLASSINSDYWNDNASLVFISNKNLNVPPTQATINKNYSLMYVNEYDEVWLLALQ